MADAQVCAKLLEYGDLAPARGSTNDRVHFARRFVVPETGSEDAIWRHNSFQGRLNNLLRRCGDHVEIKLVFFTKIVQNSCEQRDVMLQANSPAGLHEVLAAHAAKIRIMENQIAELRTLLNEVDVRKALDLVVKAVKTNELAQHDSRIVETERLIERSKSLASRNFLVISFLLLARLLLRAADQDSPARAEKLPPCLRVLKK